MKTNMMEFNIDTMQNSSRLLFDTIKSMNFKKFADLLNSLSMIDIDIKDESGNTLLYYATLYNNSDMLLLLLNKQARMDYTDGDGKTIIFTAIKYDYYDLIRTILEHNRNNFGQSVTEIKDKQGEFPLHYAIKIKNTRIIKLLIDYGANVNSISNDGYNSLHIAILTRQYDIIEYIINKTTININGRTNTGDTALHIATNMRMVNVIKLLIDNKANVNYQNYDNDYTPLHYAINNNHNDIIMILIESGADPNLQDVKGNNALHYCVYDNNYKALEDLLSYNPNVNVNTWNIDGKTPMHIALDAVDNEHIQEYIDMLIDKTNINIQDINGNTCLHHLCRYELWKPYVRELSQKKMDITILNDKSMRPVDYVKDNLRAEFVDLLVDSYLHRIRTMPSEWINEWENICK